MKYSIRKIHKKVGRFEEFQEVTCVCAESDGIVSTVAEIHDSEEIRDDLSEIQ